MKLFIKAIEVEENISILNKKEGLFEASFKMTGRVIRNKKIEIWKGDEIYLRCIFNSKKVSDIMIELFEE